MPDHDVIRWLLRPLAEDAFLRLYLEDGSYPFSLRSVEDTFWALPADGERPERARQEAWEILGRWVHSVSGPIDLFRAVLKGLLAAPWGSEVENLARFWGLPEIFEELNAGPKRASPPATDYHEIHCHLRGGVPYLALFCSWLDNERHRLELRRHACTVGRWSMTWAELVDEARRFRTDSRVRNGTDAAAFVRRLIARVILPNRSVARVTAAVRYLAICATLRRTLIHQRGKTGLSEFVSSYNRYSKLQKIRGDAESNHTRKLVGETLRRFEEDGATAVELRPTLERRPRDLRRKLLDVVLGYFDYLRDAKNPLLLGLVPSLFKQEKPNGHDDAPLIWEEQATIWQEQIRMLLDALDETPALRWFVVGVDAAGKERGCPPRVLGPAIAAVQRYNQAWGVVAARPGRCMSLNWLRELAKSDPVDAFDALDQCAVSRIRLGITVHAGEDFEDPVTGLRHLWETACHLDLQAGDRIGHAIAAGLDEDRLRTLLERRAGGSEVERLGAGGRYRIHKPRGTHLLDLAWIASIADHDHERRVALRALAEVGARAFGAPLSAERIARELTANGAVVRLGLPAVRFEDPGHVAPEVREWVTIDNIWFGVYDELRLQVLGEIIRRNLVVESCPTSNCAVANIQEPPLEVLARYPGLRVALATDDPGLLGAFPRTELCLFDTPRQQILLDESRRASFVFGLRA